MPWWAAMISFSACLPVRWAARERGQVDAVPANGGRAALPGGAVKTVERAVGGAPVALAGLLPGDVHQRHERDDRDVRWEWAGGGEDLVLPPAQFGGEFGDAGVGGDEGGEVEDPGGAGHVVAVARWVGWPAR